MTMTSRRLKILSSDDDEGIRALLFSLLTDQGNEVEFAKDSDEVFKNLGRTKYDLLILDVNTPGLNGYKVAEKISENIENRPKILIFTARNIQEENFQFVSSGADAIIQKGASCEKITSVINELCGHEAPLERVPPAQETAQAKEDGADMQESIPETHNARPADKINEDLQYCISRTAQLEDSMKLKNLRYEEFIRDLLKEKQRTEKNYLEFKRIEEQVITLKNWGYAVAAISTIAILRSFI